MAGPTVFLAPSYRPPQPQRPTLDGALLHTKNVELRARKSGGRVGGMAEEENHERIDAATGDSLALGRLSLAVFLSSLNGDSHLFATKANRYSTAHDPGLITIVRETVGKRMSISATVQQLFALLEEEERHRDRSP